MPHLDAAFLSELKDASERRWAASEPDPRRSGFQFARSTRWLPGLAADGLARLERDYGLSLPEEARAFLGAMNGTEPETVNLYGGRQAPARRPGVYSYPRDAATVKGLMELWAGERAAIRADLASQGFDLPDAAPLLPLFGHRALACGAGPVLSIQPGDSVVYAPDLRAWLGREFLDA